MRAMKCLALLGALFVVGPMVTLYWVGVPVLYRHNEPEAARIAAVVGPVIIVGMLFLCLAILYLLWRRR